MNQLIEMLTQFRNLTLRTKLILIQLLTSGLLLLIFVGYYVIDENQEYRVNAVHQLTTSSQILASNSVSALYFLDMGTANEVLSSLSTQSSITNAWIHDSEGAFFASYGRAENQDISPPIDLMTGMHFSGNYITYSREIIHDEEVLGTLTLRFDASDRWKHLSTKLFVASLILIIGLVLAYFLSISTQKSISRPIFKLSQIIQRVSESREFTIRVDEKRTDEIGVLYKGFNEMMKRIEDYDRERDVAEHALAKSKNYVQNLFDSSLDMIVSVDQQRHIVQFNTAALKTFGYQPDEIIGKPVEMLYADLEASKMIGDQISETGMFVGEISNVRKNGEVFPSLISAAILLDEQGEIIGTVGNSRDITKHKQAESELAVYRNHLEELVKERTNELEMARASLAKAQGIAHLGSWDWNIVDNTLRCSKEMHTIFGTDTEHTINNFEAFMSSIHPDDQVAVQESINKAISTNIPCSTDHRIVRPDGSERTVHEQGEVLYDEHGKPVSLLGTVSDITERNQIAEELKKAKEVAEAANQHLLELDKLKSMFIASMSHELRTPLNSIIGFTGMMLQGISGKINKLQAENLQRVYQSGKHLLSLISDIIDISKIEAGRIDVYPQKFSLEDLINEAVATILPEAKKKDIPVTIAASVWPEIESDKKRLLQCVLNLLSNAVKYSEQGRIEVNINEYKERVEISVRDTGIGISESDLPILFEAFERLESHLRIISGGTGLGLYLTKKIIQELLKGDISVKSPFGEGSTFTLSVPRVYSQNFQG